MERSQESLSGIETKLRFLIVAAEDRGRDSYGIISFYRDQKPSIFRRLGKPSLSIKDWTGAVVQSTTVVINNNRAEPTPEYVKDKSDQDIQPFGEQIFVTHNGIIANDHELQREYDLHRQSSIDSAIIPPLLEHLWDGSTEGLQAILREKLLGSYALAIVSSRKPMELYLACNYKPLFLEYDRQNRTLFFSSLESYFGTGHILDSNPVREVKPYSLLHLDSGRGLEEVSLWRHNSAIDRKALVVCSGGLDSTVSAKLMKDRGYDVTLLHFRHGQRAEAKESRAVNKIAKMLGVQTFFFDTDTFKKIGHSTLLDSLKEITTREEGVSGAEFAHEWVPARNLIFLSIATGIAEAYGYGVIATGINLEEAGAYPDNEMIFNIKLSHLLPHATQFQKRVKVEMPVGNLMKHEIVQLGLEINAPLNLTWSCYEGGDNHCGKCGPCFMRLKAFEINDRPDPLLQT